MVRTSIHPHEERDQLDRAESWYNEPLRTQNKELMDENMRLKKLLRENGISWSPLFTFGLDNSASPTQFRRRTRSSTGSMFSVERNARLPTLPVEVQLQILEYSLTSKYPIMDPLSKLKEDNMTVDEKIRGNQIAIGFLATCKAYSVEGTRFLWNNNTFVFTCHDSLRNFACLKFELRSQIKQISLRIIAKYYDDEKRTHSVAHTKFPSGHGLKQIKLKVIPRAKETDHARAGFRSYTWTQTADFLDALRPPFDPSHYKNEPRPRLLPNLESLRIDFVNFPYNYLSFPDSELHQLAAHDLGCTLNELILTGVPKCEVGGKAAYDLSGMVKDDGLMIKANDTFVYAANMLRPIQDCEVSSRVMRSWVRLAKEYTSENGENSSSMEDHIDHMVPHWPPGPHHGHPQTEPAPLEEGHPESCWERRRTMWKRVPVTRDSKEREWVEFDRVMGGPMSHWTRTELNDIDDIDSLVCDGCGEIHDPDSWDAWDEWED
ncbi:hypothetical protein B0T22DRAFT_439830 [Podospora appendiculata]|uniref:Uncharacterized protein n=1 Tax=Podospora appendiculata TaxID=314037 RepID=A0AAE0X8Y9_9PEZI|nr:hypothetical protein B0T22DRAFT_439830 [Podospora appendiculata]